MALHRRYGYRFVTPYRVILRTVGHGLLQRVLDRRPLTLPAPEPGAPCVHILTKANECLFALWACRSLLERLDPPLALFVHDDGSLHEHHYALIAACLPGAKVVRRAEADVLAAEALAPFPRCQAFRAANNLALKLFDPWIVQTDGDLVLIDSDVLVFRRPEALINWLADPGGRVNRWNLELTDKEDSHELTDAAGPCARPGFNSGLGFLTRDLMSFEAVEQLLGYREIFPIDWLVEQEVYGRLSASAGMAFLPPSYHVADGRTAAPDQLVAKHYVGVLRGLFITEGLRWLLRQSDWTSG